MNSVIAGQLNEAGTLMLVGMGFVFAFLALLIGGIKLIELICRQFPGKPEPVVSVPKAGKGNIPQTDDVTPETIAAISAALYQYRQTNNKEQEKA